MFCGSVFVTSTAKKKDHVFCSRSCASAGSVTEKRRNTARKFGGRNKAFIVGTHDKVLRKREAWKYPKIAEFLAGQFRHEFEVRIADFIVDLYLPEIRTVIEFDGKDHRTPKQAKMDYERDSVLKRMGYSVFRIGVEPNQVIPAQALADVLGLKAEREACGRVIAA